MNMSHVVRHGDVSIQPSLLLEIFWVFNLLHEIKNEGFVEIIYLMLNTNSSVKHLVPTSLAKANKKATNDITANPSSMMALIENTTK